MVPTLGTHSLERYAAVVHHWNRTIRLVGPRQLAGVQTQIVDALLPFLIHPPPFPLVDIGSGAGLPAVPIALMHRRKPILCLEPRTKRASFLRHVLRDLDLSAVEVLAARTNQVPSLFPEHLSRYAAATARAVGNIRLILSAARPFLCPGGLVYLPRGEEPTEDLPDWELVLDAPYTPPLGLGPRRLVIYRSRL